MAAQYTLGLPGALEAAATALSKTFGMAYFRQNRPTSTTRRPGTCGPDVFSEPRARCNQVEAGAFEKPFAFGA